MLKRKLFLYRLNEELFFYRSDEGLTLETSAF